MLLKIDHQQKLGNAHISILYPGKVLGNTDTGIGSIGRIDQAHIGAGATIKMHPHVNDDILSYFRTGKVQHTDSAGITELISRNKLMLMKSGKVFYHEEKILAALEGLQIFLRPKYQDDSPAVEFAELSEADSLNSWRLIASPDKDALLQLSSQTWIYDMHLSNAETHTLPPLPKEQLTGLLYVFQGSLTVNEDITLKKGESVIFKEEEISFKTDSKAELVLFFTDEAATYFAQGMFSGNQYII